MADRIVLVTHAVPMAVWFEGFLDRLFGVPSTPARGAFYEGTRLQQPREDRV